MPALEGVKVLDLTQYEAGTSCTQYLAWFGAEVYKVERPGVGDPGRHVAGHQSDSLYFLSFNHNKKSVAIALDTEQGRDLFLKLVPKVDVVVENFTLGTMEKLGLGYDVLRAANPAIIYATIKGFGTYGPHSSFKCFDRIAQAAGGAASVTGSNEGPPTMPGATFGDTGSGVHCALGITAAYVQRLRTGEGQMVEIAMQEVIATFMREPLSHRQWNPTPEARRGNRTVVPTDMYPTKGGGPNDYLYIFVATSRMLDAVFTTIGKPELLDDPRFATTPERRANGDALYEEVKEWTLRHTKQEAMDILGANGVPCSAIYDTEDLFRDEHLNERNMVREIEHPTYGKVTMLAPPIHLSASDVEMVRAPLLGEHTAAVLGQELGLAASELRSLADAGVLALEPAVAARA
jgi:formyl-CoA transferase